MKFNNSYFLQSNMSLFIGKRVTDDYKLVRDFKTKGKMKLYQKDNSFLCTMINPWFDPYEILYIQIEVNQKQLMARRSPPLAFSKKESAFFTECLTYLINTIIEALADETSHVRKMQVEYVSMVFWAKNVMICVNQNKNKGIWDDTSDLLYSLAQIIYVSFDVAQRQCIAEENAKLLLSNSTQSNKRLCRYTWFYPFRRYLALLNY